MPTIKAVINTTLKTWISEKIDEAMTLHTSYTDQTNQEELDELTTDLCNIIQENITITNDVPSIDEKSVFILISELFKEKLVYSLSLNYWFAYTSDTFDNLKNKISDIVKL